MSDPRILEEPSGLSEPERRWAEHDLALRERAALIAADLALDARDVYHVLRSLERTPSERLRRGLSHGRIGLRLHP